mmetsp:Transcript_1820/g.4262  ORF Transcript_1820/g.4262 Transcript_1820/m.4262 type:complete len:119 (+) Transcript_1820:941-1297(+)
MVATRPCDEGAAFLRSSETGRAEIGADLRWLDANSGNPVEVRITSYDPESGSGGGDDIPVALIVGVSVAGFVAICAIGIGVFAIMKMRAKRRVYPIDEQKSEARTAFSDEGSESPDTP